MRSQKKVAFQKEIIMAAHIVVIDDDQTLREAFRLILEPEGYEVSVAQQVYEDLVEVEALHPDLILFNISLYKVEEGFFFLRRLHTYFPTKDIPVLLCTAAEARIRTYEDYLRDKGIPIVSKPFDIDELLKVVKHMTEPQIQESSV
jgi:CheY-like chemotaxis protein